MRDDDWLGLSCWERRIPSQAPFQRLSHGDWDGTYITDTRRPMMTWHDDVA